MPEDVQHSELHGLTEFFPVTLEILPGDRLATTRRSFLLVIDLCWIRNFESFYQELQQVFGGAETPDMREKQTSNQHIF